MNQIAGSDLIQAGQSFGKFYLVKTIGEGGTSKIFKALQQPINRVVAVKIPSFTANGEILTPDEFLSEATLMAKLDHAGIARIFDFGVTENRPFICMEYVDGFNLQELTEEKNAWSLSGILAAALQILEALNYAHGKNVLHLDLSPANVLVAQNGILKLLDFGMAGKKAVKGQHKIIGTPSYLSPEHIMGSDGKRESDLFSFGSLVYFLATGQLLFDPGLGNTNVTQMLKHIEVGRVNPPLAKIEKLPPVLSDIVKAALEGSINIDASDSVSLEIKSVWEKMEGNAMPSQVLQRELNLSSQSVHTNQTLSNEQIKEKYFKLRDLGRHRDAVALLETELKKHPHNTALNELLTAAPTKAKSLQATVAVNNSIPVIKNSKKVFGLVSILGLAMVVIGSVFMMIKKPKSEKSNPNTPSLTLASNTLVSATPLLNRLPKTEVAIPKASHLKPDFKKTVPKFYPPALTVNGPKGIRVSVNDSSELITPAPKKGWPLPTGLVNLTFTQPGQSHSINTTLFVSNDSIYGIEFDQSGRFSVSRKHR